MTPERFLALLDSRGADLRRWPEAERDAARALLERALATNPYFHHRQPDIARAVLDSLGTGAMPVLLARSTR